MTRYEQGFLTKCASAGVPENVATALLKRAYELGSASRNLADTDKIRPDDFHFAQKDPKVYYSDFDDSARTASPTSVRPQTPGWWREDMDFGPPPYLTDKINEYNDEVKRTSTINPDGLFRRYPIVEDGKYNSTSWKDSKDLANLQSDAIRRRRDHSRPMIFDKKIQRWRPQDYGYLF